MTHTGGGSFASFLASAVRGKKYPKKSYQARGGKVVLFVVAEAGPSRQELVC